MKYLDENSIIAHRAEEKAKLDFTTTDLGELQGSLNQWLEYYNNERTHQGKMCYGRTPINTLLDGKRICQEKCVT